MERIVHFYWHQGFDEMPRELWRIPKLWADLNPNHKLAYWDAKNIGKLVKEHYPLLAGVFDRIARTDTEKVAAVKSSDLARLLILHHHGGFYVDTDCEPFLPLSHLFGGSLVRHRFAKFDYSRNNSPPTVLSAGDDPFEREVVDWSRYDLVLSREHQLNPELGGCAAANTAIMARKGSPLLEAIISAVLPDWNEKVLRFCGPHAISKAIRATLPAFKGKAYMLPPWYLLWQTSDMGAPWKHTVCRHMNRLDWTNLSDPVPWDC